jgi:hypothetical protein
MSDEEMPKLEMLSVTDCFRFVLRGLSDSAWISLGFTEEKVFQVRRRTAANLCCCYRQFDRKSNGDWGRAPQHDPLRPKDGVQRGGMEGTAGLRIQNAEHLALFRGASRADRGPLPVIRAQHGLCGSPAHGTPQWEAAEWRLGIPAAPPC